jgi:hypothetical protein
MQRTRAGDHALGLDLAERCFDRRTVQHRHRPVIAQAGLVVAQMQRTRCRLFQQRQARAHIVIEHGWIGEGIQHHGAGELLGDGAHAEQRARRERDAPLRIGPAPGMAHQHLALLQYSYGAAWPGIRAREPFNGTFEAGREGGGHACHFRACGRAA